MFLKEANLLLTLDWYYQALRSVSSGVQVIIRVSAASPFSSSHNISCIDNFIPYTREYIPSLKW